MTSTQRLLVTTKKGLWVLHGAADRRSWKLEGPHFLGHLVHHAALDPRDGRTMLVAVSTGHLGPTVQRSDDGGATFTEVAEPPRFHKAPHTRRARSVGHVFWLTPSNASEPGVWYAATSPQGLFRSEDGGKTWAGVDGLNEHPDLDTWTGGEKDGTPDGPKLHSVIVDPRDARHLYVGMSGGGTFESLDRGATWTPLNQGVHVAFGPDPFPEFGQDPHCVVMTRTNPDRLYQQNHCGIYRLDRPGDRWVRIGDNMPKDVGDIGFPIAAHPRDADTVWVYPMDGTDVWPRTSPGGKPAVYRSRDAGATWQRLSKGLPPEQAWWSVKRQCLTVDDHDPVGVYFGTCTGVVWGSLDEGDSWAPLVQHLPHIYSVSWVRS